MKKLSLTSYIAMIYYLHPKFMEDAAMGYQSKVQVIERGGIQRQFYLICPAPLAQALEIEKGETIEWIVEDKWTLRVRRLAGESVPARRGGTHGKR